MPVARKRELTTPDLVLLSLLSERPMHGYQANLELERRQVRDWAGISRPQVYYSLEKLQGQGLIHCRECGSGGRAGTQRFHAHREGAQRSGGCTRARGMGDAKGTAALSHVDGSVLAGETWSLRTATAAAAAIPGEGNEAGRRDIARDPGGGWPRLS